MRERKPEREKRTVSFFEDTSAGMSHATLSTGEEVEQRLTWKPSLGETDERTTWRLVQCNCFTVMQFSSRNTSI